MAETTVWPELVVFLSKVTHHHARLGQRPQLLLVQTLVPEPVMGVFHKPFLPRAAGLIVNRLDPILPQPALHILAINSKPLLLRRYSGVPCCATPLVANAKPP